MPSPSPRNDYLLYILGVIDDLDPLNTNGTPKTIDNATVTWEIRDDEYPAGSQVASGSGAIVATGPLAAHGNYFCELSNSIAFLAEQDFWYHVVVTAGAYKADLVGSFRSIVRSGQTSET